MRWCVAFGEIIEILFSFYVTNIPNKIGCDKGMFSVIGAVPGFSGRRLILRKHQTNLLVNLESKEVDHFSSQNKFIWILKRIMKRTSDLTPEERQLL